MTEKKPITVQNIAKTYPTAMDVLTHYVSILATLNSLSISPLEIKLLAYTAIRGTISPGTPREQFTVLTSTSKGTIANMVYKLLKNGYLIKNKERISVHPIFALSFSKGLVLKLKLEVEEPVYE